MKYAYFIFILFIFCCISCVKDKPNPDVKYLPSVSSRGVVILNEGSFGNNNAEISYLDLSENKLSNLIYRNANDKSLGDVAQHVQFYENHFFILLNNSNKLVVLDALTWKLKVTVSGIVSPRYMVFADSKIFISSLSQNVIYVVDANSLQLIDQVLIDDKGAENMMLVGNEIWITHWNIQRKQVFILNTQTRKMEDKIELPYYASHAIVQDRNDMVWILAGNKYQNRRSALMQIHPTTHQIIQQFEFPEEAEPIRLQMNATKDTLYFIQVNYDGGANHNGLYRMSIDDVDLPNQAFIAAMQNSYFWAYGIDSVSKHIFISDPKGFTQQSSIYEYSNQAKLLYEYRAGIGANQFLFTR